jgi:hypothetical protein
VRQEKRGGWKDRRLIAVVVTAAVSLPALAGFTLGRSSPEPVEILQVACGLPRETVSFSLPGTLLALAGSSGDGMHVPVWLGPFRHQGTADVVRLRFSGDADGGGASIARVDDVLHLPVNLGDPDDPPRRILLHCRNDVVAWVQYVSRGGVSKDFPVVRSTTAEGLDGDPHYAAK